MSVLSTGRCPPGFQRLTPIRRCPPGFQRVTPFYTRCIGGIPDNIFIHLPSNDWTNAETITWLKKLSWINPERPLRTEILNYSVKQKNELIQVIRDKIFPRFRHCSQSDYFTIFHALSALNISEKTSQEWIAQNLSKNLKTLSQTHLYQLFSSIRILNRDECKPIGQFLLNSLEDQNGDQVKFITSNANLFGILRVLEQSKDRSLKSYNFLEQLLKNYTSYTIREKINLLYGVSLFCTAHHYRKKMLKYIERIEKDIHDDNTLDETAFLSAFYLLCKTSYYPKHLQKKCIQLLTASKSDAQQVSIFHCFSLVKPLDELKPPFQTLFTRLDLENTTLTIRTITHLVYSSFIFLPNDQMSLKEKYADFLAFNLTNTNQEELLHAKEIFCLLGRASPLLHLPKRINPASALHLFEKIYDLLMNDPFYKRFTIRRHVKILRFKVNIMINFQKCGYDQKNILILRDTFQQSLFNEPLNSLPKTTLRNSLLENIGYDLLVLNESRDVNPEKTFETAKDFLDKLKFSLSIKEHNLSLNHNP